MRPMFRGCLLTCSALQLAACDFFRSCLAPKFLELKVGAQVRSAVVGTRAATLPHTRCAGPQVMLLANMDVGRGLFNGSRGVVKGFAPPDTASDLVDPSSKTSEVAALDPPFAPADLTPYIPMVQFLHLPAPVPVCQRAFVGEIAGVGKCKRVQIPLKLAWAITVHKCQGMTLDLVQVRACCAACTTRAPQCDTRRNSLRLVTHHLAIIDTPPVTSHVI